MQSILLVVHVLLAVSLIGLILIQHGKGADAGAAFGSGASATVFGAQGSGSFLTRLTAILATLFFTTSLTLAYLSGKTVEVSSVAEKIASAPKPDQTPKPDQKPAKPLDVPVPEGQVPVLPSVTPPIVDKPAPAVVLPAAQAPAVKPALELAAPTVTVTAPTPAAPVQAVDQPQAADQPPAQSTVPEGLSAAEPQSVQQPANQSLPDQPLEATKALDTATPVTSTEIPVITPITPSEPVKSENSSEVLAPAPVEGQESVK